MTCVIVDLVIACMSLFELLLLSGRADAVVRFLRVNVRYRYIIYTYVAI